MTKQLSLLLIFIVLLLSTSRLAFAAVTGECGGEPLCPAPVGECVAGGPWEVGVWMITQTDKVCRCASSNESCEEGSTCSVYDKDDPYAPRDENNNIYDPCICHELGDDPFCDSSWWTYCCTPGNLATTSTPAPTDGTDPSGGDSGTTTPVTSYISGSIQQDLNAIASGDYCAQSSLESLNLTGINISVLNTASPDIIYQVVTLGSNYSVNTGAIGSTYTVTLDLTGQTGGTNYICSCPAPIDPANPYVCRYTGVSSPGYNVNFYLKDYNLSNESWFQVFGGNLFGRYGVASSIPATFCATDANCQAALSVLPIGSTDQNFSGFAITNVANSGSIISSSSEGFTHSYLTLADRTNNVNAYAVNTDLSQLSYDYFVKLAENSLQVVGDGSSLKPIFSDWTGSDWWQTDEVNYVQVNGSLIIDETQGFNLNSNQNLVVFVTGSILFDDSDPDDTNRQITSVDPGGFLAFFANGNITVSANIGYELDPNNPSTPAVSDANTNLEGVFVASDNLVFQSSTALDGLLPDRKFIGAGTFVGWNNVLLDRTFDDDDLGAILSNTQAVENFVYRPDLLANWPTKLKTSVSNWREVDPQFIEQ